jgi:Ca-activated chloride channel homolog
LIFKSPWVLFLIPVVLLFYFIKRRRLGGGFFVFPTRESIKDRGNFFKLWLVSNVVLARVLSLIFILLALADPVIREKEPIRKAGLAVILAIDCSSSMLAEDLKLDFQSMAREDVPKGTRNLRRIDGVKLVAKDFTEKREDNLTGVVAFAAEAFLVCPLTFHNKWVIDAINRVDVGLIKDATAIGSGMMAGLNSLKDMDARSRIIILLTDGINNYGSVPPLVAAKVARTLGVKVYTIGLVSNLEGFSPTEDRSGRRVFTGRRIDVDEDELKDIAELTGGKYFRAQDFSSLSESYKQIDLLEKTVMERGEYQEDVKCFSIFVYLAGFLLILEILISGLLLRKIP